MSLGVSPSSLTVPYPPMKVYNNTGSTLTVGQLVYVSGWNAVQGLPQVSLSDKGVAGARAALLVTDAILSGASGVVYPCDQSVTSINVGAAAVGDAVFLGTAGGYVFTTAPSTGRTERIGVVTATGASGSIYLVPTALQASS